MSYTSRAAREAESCGYGNRDYWDYLEEQAQLRFNYFMDKRELEIAQSMINRSLTEALRGNEGN